MSKTAYPLKMPTSLKHSAERLAEKDGVSLNQWINMAVAQKIGAVETAALLRQRYGAAQPDDLRAALGKVPNNPPEPGDELEINSTTADGVAFGYLPSGDGYRIMAAGGGVFEIPNEHVKAARGVLAERGKMALGASRTDPTPNSLGFALLERFATNYASYIAAILRDERFCEIVREGRGYVLVHRAGAL